ncbi:CASP-like protein 1F2 [Salvia miltiorrhiza]|uniref:CASP-like protein 1F2 n=1 Tax=Salvia miltiorrhiza TaxID=226208 RepID=UPI0025AC385D|nr:CASP-like protein 1F2 [Salvia miltiorrhiza]
MSSQILKKSLYFTELALRVVVIAFSVAGAISMVTSKESVTMFGITVNASYTYSSSFRYKVVADSVVCGLTVLSVILVIWLNHPKSNPKNYFYLLLNDLVSLVLLVSACSAAMAIGFVGRYGQSQTGWVSICDRVQKFCDKIMVSIVISFLAAICLFLLTLMSAHNLKSHSFLESNSIPTN